AATLGAVTSVVFGLPPALRVGRLPLTSVLSQRGANAGRRFRARAGTALVLTEFTLAMMLVATSAWLLIGIRGLQAQDLGIDREHLLLAWTAPGQTTRGPSDLVVLAAALQQRVSQMPGVSAVGIASNGPLNGIEGNHGSSDGIDVRDQGPKPGLLVTRAAISSTYLAAVGTPLVAGRDFTEHDTETSAPVVIINQTLARFEFGEASAVGKHIGTLGDRGTPREIVGVVRDAKYNTVRDDRMGMLYLPYRQRPQDLGSMCVVARVVGDPRLAVERVRAELASIDANLPILKIDTVREQLNAVLVQERLVATLSSFFSSLALLLASLGIFGLVAYTVTLKTSEIGIRMALGAARRTIVSMFLRDVIVMASAGIILGVSGALAMNRVITSRLSTAATNDSRALVITAAILLVVTALAAFLPIRRATKVDPVVALRYD
ncbi:MAG TPA: FtsX-like permease family protein, partial [Vicinamibacterales bacterium]